MVDMATAIAMATEGAEPGGGDPADLGTSLPDRLPHSTASLTYYVNSSTGDDARSAAQAQSPSTPWLTPNKAVATVTTPGSVVMITGTYSGNRQLYVLNKNISGTLDNPITFKAETAGSWVITKTTATGTFYGCNFEGSSGYRVEGLTISKFLGNDGGTGAGGANDGLGATGIFVEDSQKIEFLNCILEDIGGHGVQVRGVSGSPCEDIWFYGCIFRPTGTTSVSYDGSASSDYFCGVDCTGPYYKTRGTHGIYCGQMTGGDYSSLNGDDRTVIANCLFVGSTPGVCVSPHPQSRYTYIVNNTFYGNNNPYFVIAADVPADGHSEYAAGCGIIIGNDGSATSNTTDNVHVVNNIFSTLRGHAIRGDGSAMNNNLVYNNLAYTTLNGEGEQGRETEAFEELWNGHTMFAETGGQIATNTNPVFVSPAASPAGNFALQSGSPCKLVANPAYCPPIDITGASRSGTPSLGAYE
jgi:hypothetical protein